ncbi:MAG TPA: hypothetical protein VK900_16045 [Anaerolineales bacterium]|nr:hypothetical protein [Anaerolineales bacterium]
MKHKVAALFSIVILTAVFMSAFASPPQTGAFQETAVPPEVTVVVPTVVLGTPGVPVTGAEGAPTGLWTLILFGLLGLLAMAFLVAMFSPRRTVAHDHHDHIDTPPHDHGV